MTKLMYDATRYQEDTVLRALADTRVAEQQFCCVLCRQSVNPFGAYWHMQRASDNRRIEFLPLHVECAESK